MEFAHSRQQTTWLTVALLTGVAVALLPVPIILGVGGGMVLLGIFFLEPALALVFTLSVAPLKTLLETEAPLPLPLDVGQLALGLFIGIWALRWALDSPQRIRSSPILMTGISFFIFTASLSLWTAYSASHVMTELLKWFQILAIVIILPNVRRWEWLVLGLGLSAALQAVIGIWQFQGGSGAAHLWILNYRFFRAFGTFGQPNPFGGFMGMVLPIMLATGMGAAVAAYVEKEKRQAYGILSLIFGSLAGVILLGLLVSWSRGAWLGFIGAMVVLVWMFPTRRWMGTAALGTGAMFVGLLWLLGLLPASLTDRLTGFSEDFTGISDVRGVVINDENFAVVERLAHWQSAGSMAESSPWLGVGFNNYEVAYPEYKLINWQFALGHAHNYYLNLLAETGIIGLVGYLVMWGTVVLYTWHFITVYRDQWVQRGILVGLMGAWTHISIHSLIDKLYVNNLFLHIGVMFGLLAALSVQARETIYGSNGTAHEPS